MVEMTETIIRQPTYELDLAIKDQNKAHFADARPLNAPRLFDPVPPALRLIDAAGGSHSRLIT
jgi:hypothetical protein